MKLARLRTMAALSLTFGLAAWGGDGVRAEFQPGYERPGLDNWATDMVVFDDGGGERLFVAGRFRTAEGLEVRRIAAWDGTGWAALAGPSGQVGMDVGPAAIAVFDDGSGPALYVAGTFGEAGGAPFSNIARWDGTIWSDVGGGVGGEFGGDIRDLAVFDDGTGPALYAGGQFDSAGGAPATDLARWDGQAWSAVDGLTAPSRVERLAVHDDGTGPALIVGGAFTAVDGQAVSNIARWDGMTWSALGSPGAEGVTGDIQALASFDSGSGPELFVGGRLQTAGGVPSRHLVRFDGSSWSSAPLGTTDPDGVIWALDVFDLGGGPRLVVGSFQRFDEFVRLTTFDGTTWRSPVVEQLANGGIYCLEMFNGSLIVGGEFDGVGDRALSNIASVEGNELQPLAVGPNLGMSGGTLTSIDLFIDEFAVFDAGQGPELYAGGPVNAGAAVVNGLARLRSGEWTSVVDVAGRRLANAIDSDHALMTYDDGILSALIVAGDLLEGPGATGLSEVLRWDGSDWTELGDLTGSISDLAAFDDGSGLALYASGSLDFGAVTGARLARWDGAVWSEVQVPSEYEGSVTALEAHDGTLYVGLSLPSFDFVGDVLVRWDGLMWSSFAPVAHNSENPGVSDIHFFDDGSGPMLLITGDFRSAADVILNDVARWDADGEQWLPLGEGLNGGDGSDVSGVVLRESAGVLYLGGVGKFGGDFFTSGIVERWSGSQWFPLGSPDFEGGGRVADLLDLADIGGEGLLIGGKFIITGGVVSSSIAEFRFQPNIFVDGFESGDTSAWTPSP